MFAECRLRISKRFASDPDVTDSENLPYVLQITKKNDVIRRLQADLHQIEKFSEEHIRRTKSEAEKQQAADVKNSEGKASRLQQELHSLESTLLNNVQEHRDTEGELRKVSHKPP